MTSFYLYLGFLLVMSLLSFLLYGIDKGRARKEKWRIRESVLLLTGFFGGASGALAAMTLFRHKTKHVYFWIINLIGLAFQFFLLILILRSM